MLRSVGDPALASLFELVRVLGIHAARYLEQHSLLEFGRLNIHKRTQLSEGGERKQRAIPFVAWIQADSTLVSFVTNMFLWSYINSMLR